MEREALMLRFLADENFHGDILRGLFRREPALQILRVQDTEVSGADDPAVLEFAARQQLVVLTHDFSTMAHYAYERVGNSLPMPGVLKVSRKLTIGRAVDEILMIAVCARPEELRDLVLYVPLD